MVRKDEELLAPIEQALAALRALHGRMAKATARQLLARVTTFGEPMVRRDAGNRILALLFLPMGGGGAGKIPAEFWATPLGQVIGMVGAGPLVASNEAVQQFLGVSRQRVVQLAREGRITVADTAPAEREGRGRPVFYQWASVVAEAQRRVGQ